MEFLRQTGRRFVRDAFKGAVRATAVTVYAALAIEEDGIDRHLQQ